MSTFPSNKSVKKKRNNLGKCLFSIRNETLIGFDFKSFFASRDSLDCEVVYLTSISPLKNLKYPKIINSSFRETKVNHFSKIQRDKET